jgi:hypothetical protein
MVRPNLGRVNARPQGGPRSARRRLLPALLSAAALALFLAAPAAAQTFTVTKTTDTSVTAGDGTLRGEIRAANEHPGADTVVFAPGVAGQITISSAGYVISGPIEIDGPGSEVLNVHQTSANHRVIEVKLTEPGAVTISGLELSGGESSGPGGDLWFNQEGEPGSVTVSDCTILEGTSQDYGGGIAGMGAPLIVRDSLIQGNEADAAGGIWAGDEQPLTIEGSEIAGNRSMRDGGGLLEEEATVTTIVDSTFLSNFAEELGGGADITARPRGAATVANTTANGNEAGGSGGAFYWSGGDEVPLTIEDSTIAGNHGGAALGDAGGIQSSDLIPQTLVDSIVSGNTSGGAPDIGGAWTASFSLIGNPLGGQITSAVPGSNLLGVDPQLSAPVANGGPVPTMALAPTSPAVNKGGGALATDARGEPRPVAYPGVALATAPGANGADIGAYELQVPVTTGLVPPPPPPVVPAKPGDPRVRLACPKSAGKGGCAFALTAVSGKPKRVKGKLRQPTVESATAKLKLAAGKSGSLTLKPKAKFATRLRAARSLLVRQTEKVSGHSHTSYRRLKVGG